MHKYSEPAVTDAIAEADVVFLGVDRREPILRARQLAGLRDYAARPLTIVDFNTFGSTEGVAAIDGIRVIDARQLEAQVDRFAEALLTQVELNSAAEAAERAILAYVESITNDGDWPGASSSAAPLPQSIDPELSPASPEVKEPVICEGGSHAQLVRR